MAPNTIGIHHWVSPKHLDAYGFEMTVRFNSSDMTSIQRANGLLGQIEGPLLSKALMNWGEALSRSSETKPHDVEPQPGKARKAPRPKPGAKPASSD